MTINTELLVRILDINKDMILQSTPKNHYPKFGEDYILGCGEYGCVFETKSKNIVFKLTTDPKEYKFVVDAMNLGEWPEGMIQYYQAMKLDSAFTRIDFYGLWRESAEDVGSLSDTEIDANFFIALGICWRVVNQIRYNYDENYDEIFYTGVCDWIRDQVDTYINSTRINAGEFNSILHAMRWYAERGILLGDVHLGNFGKVKRDGKWTWVITNPGFALFVEDEIDAKMFVIKFNYENLRIINVRYYCFI